MTLYDTFIALKKKTDQEALDRAKIQYSDDYLAFNRVIESAKQEQEFMLSDIPDSSKEFQQVKEALMLQMKQQGVSSMGDARAKYKEKKGVNQARLLEVIGGDMDVYVSLSSVSQVALKDYAKNSLQKEELLGCIEIVEKELIDLEVLEPSAA